MKKLVLVFLTLLTLSSMQLLAQDLAIKGKVTDNAGQPLTGVTVSVKGTSRGTGTDNNGDYSIKAPSNGTLVFNYIGYLSVEMPVAGKTSISVQMKEDVANLDEVVVVGYGTQKNHW